LTLLSGALLDGVLLDVDDTLVDTRGAFRHALVAIAAQYLRAGADPEEVGAFWRNDRNGWYRAHTRGEVDYRQQRKLRANDLHAQFGGSAMDDAAFDLWNEDFERGFQKGWRAHDDVETFLDALDAHGIPYGAVSNAAVDYQRLKLERCGLSRVPMFVGVDTFGVGKPDPRVFLEGASRLGTDPARTAYVGDEYDIDAVASAAAGLVAVWLDRPGTRRPTVPADAASNPHVTRVASLEHILDALAAR
jgi:putative hydrolase of the HAD superfamily